MSDTPDSPLPPLKAAIEAVQVEHEGQPVVVLRDQEGLTDQAVAVSLPGFLIATLLNGETTAADIRRVFSEKTGTVLKEEEIGGLVRQLDEAHLLETGALADLRRRTLDDFRASAVRPARMMKSGYPADRIELASFLGRFFSDPKGPGKEIAAVPSADRPLVGLVAPHIDLHRGGPAYACAYQALSDAPKPDVIVAVGVAHMSPNAPWSFTRKVYETPYGPMPVAEDLYDALRSALWYDPLDDEWAHRTEHSLEFQALWLKYLWKDETPPWVPILTSTFERFSGEKPPSTIATVDGALEKMGAVLRKRVEAGQKVMILAGIDLGHVGPRFGDALTLGPELEQKLEREDRASLERALEMDPDGLYAAVAKDGHWRKWCGLSALYTSLRLMRSMCGDRTPDGRLLAYGQAPDPMGGIVSFTSAAYR